MTDKAVNVLRVFIGLYASLWVLMRPYKSLFIPIDSMGSCRSL